MPDRRRKRAKTRKASATLLSDAFVNAYENYDVRLSRILLKRRVRRERSVTLSLCRADVVVTETAKKRMIVGVTARKC